MSSEEIPTTSRGPEPEMASKETQHPELTVRSSSLLHELTSLPLVGTLGSLYTRTRDSHWALKSGLGIVENACSMVLDKLHIGSTVAIKMDKAAGEGVTKLKHRYPALTAPPDEMLEAGKNNATFFFHKTIRKVFRTYPGQITLKLFDWSVDKADRLLRKVNPPVRSPRKRKVTRATIKKTHKAHAYASEDSGTCDTMEKRENDQELMPSETVEALPIMMINKIMRSVLVTPIEITVSSLKKVRKYLHAVSQKRKKPERPSDLSPEKEAEIESRRKISPRKRRPMSLLDQVRRTAFGVLGYKGVKMRHIQMEKSEAELLSREEAERKRKHDEILTDQGSASEESNDDDLADFDLDNYESEDDPDYEPSESDVISEDISDAETESDIECEKVGESGFVQLKEKTEGKPKESEHHEKKPLNPDEKSAELPDDTKPKDDKKKPEKSDENTEPSKDEKKHQPTSRKEKKSHKPVKSEEKTEASKDEKKHQPTSPKDKSHKPEKSEEKAEPSKDEKTHQPTPPKDKKSHKPEKSEEKAEPSKDEKKHQPTSPKDKKSHKPGEKPEPPKDESNPKPTSPKDKKKTTPGDTSVDPSKDAKTKPPQSDKLPEPAINGDKMSEDKQSLKFGKFFK